MSADRVITTDQRSPGTTRPVSRLPEPYSPPATGAAIDLFLDANEGPGGCVDLALLAAEIGPGAARRYPRASTLEAALADRLGVDAPRVLVTAGGDEAIDRACRAFLGPGRELVLPTPTFEMIERYARLAGASVVAPNWADGPYPVDAVLNQVDERTAMIAIVSPNNPTGAVASVSDLERLAAEAPRALLLVDLAYTEFADEDLTAPALNLPNAIVIRTFSKAFGLAGLRIGYAVGPVELVRAMRLVGSPYPVGGFSLAAAGEALRCAEAYLPEVVSRIRLQRVRLFELLRELGARPRRSQANFVLAEFDDAERTWRALAGLGIAVRRFRNSPGLEDALRITCPGDEPAFERLCAGLRAAMRPQALGRAGVLPTVGSSAGQEGLLP